MGGSFNLTEPVQYTARVRREMLAEQTNLDPAEVEGVNLGCGWPEGATGFDRARVASMVAGIPQAAAGTPVNRFCSLVRQLKRTGGRYGIVTMCVGGGQGFASLFEAC